MGSESELWCGTDETGEEAMMDAGREGKNERGELRLDLARESAEAVTALVTKSLRETCHFKVVEGAKRTKKE